MLGYVVVVCSPPFDTVGQDYISPLTRDSRYSLQFRTLERTALSSPEGAFGPDASRTLVRYCYCYWYCYDNIAPKY